MQQLTFIKRGKLEWWDVPAPTLQSDTDALVRPLAVARCEVDRAALYGAIPMEGPFAFGHEAVAEVIEVGDQVKRLQPGDRVIVPFQISCGTCDNCRRGLTLDCMSVPRPSTYGLGDYGGKQWGGLLSDVARVPYAEHMLIPVPQGIDPVTLASASDNIPDGYRTVGPALKANPGANVLIVAGGAHSVGLYAAGIAVAMGAGVVDYVDADVERRRLAESVGARAYENIPEKTRYRITVDASARAEGLNGAILATEPGGICTSVGIYYQPVELPLLQMYFRSITFVTGVINASPLIHDVLEVVQAGKFHPEQITTLTARWEDAADALLDRSAKVVVKRDGL